MKITRENVEAFHAGQMDDPDLCRAIQEAIGDDPRVAAWYAELDDELRSTAETTEWLAQDFRRLENSFFVPVVWKSGNENSPSIQVESSGKQLSLLIDKLPGRNRPLSLAILQPAELELRHLTLGKDRRVRLADAGEPTSVSSRSFATLAARTDGLGQQKHFLAKDGRGFEAWLEPSQSGHTYLIVSGLAPRSLPGVGHYNFFHPNMAEPALEGRFELREADESELLAAIRRHAQREQPLDLPPIEAKHQKNADIERLLMKLTNVDQPDWVRADLAQTAGQVGSAEARDALLQVLADVESDSLVHAAAAKALGNLAFAETVVTNALLTRLDDDQSPDSLRQACRNALVASTRLLISEVKLNRLGFDASPAEWTLELTIGDPHDASQFTMEELRQLPRKSFEVMPLDAVRDDGGRWECACNERQAQAWNDPSAVQLVHFGSESEPSPRTKI